MRIFFLICLGVISSLFGVEKTLFMQDIEVLFEPPTAEEFVHMRTSVGMHKKKISSAEKATKNSLFWVTLRSQGTLIGMGRLLGDGGSCVVLADIIVAPEHQRKGYGRFILETIQEYIMQEVSDDAFVCLFSNQAVTDFYEQQDFQFTEGKWPGMYWPNIERAKRKEAAALLLRSRAGEVAGG